MDYKELVEELRKPMLVDGYYLVDHYRRDAATAITDLLSRAEAAEAAQETLQRAMAEYKERAEKAERERDEAVETIFKWTGCPECKHWDSATDWCEKHDRYATTSDGCTTPEWRGMREE